MILIIDAHGPVLPDVIRIAHRKWLDAIHYYCIARRRSDDSIYLSFLVPCKVVQRPPRHPFVAASVRSLVPETHQEAKRRGPMSYWLACDLIRGRDRGTRG